ncbi:hypothetical protein XENOCAPTIV_020262 [Xenoophorus captivus]|uniref:Sema domain-containing protein n=1 Tax=Xenoophorus captivus TaxID=1517983 RepID=A0ABV0S900_9TELE
MSSTDIMVVIYFAFKNCFLQPRAVNSGRSAVCSFSLTEIKSVFSGNYKVLNRDRLQWSARVQDKVANPGEVKLFTLIIETNHNHKFLLFEIRKLTRGLTLVSAEHTYSHLTVQRVQAANKRLYTVLFLLTGEP